jgi:hypothetical protein
MRKYNDPSVSQLEKLDWSVEVLIAWFPWRAFPRCFVNSTFIRQRFSLFSLQGMPKNFLVYLSWSRLEVSEFVSSWTNFLNCQVLQLISCLWTWRVWFVKCLLKHRIEKLVVMAADVSCYHLRLSTFWAIFFLSYDHAHFNYHKRFSGKLILNLHELKNSELQMLHGLVQYMSFHFFHVFKFSWMTDLVTWASSSCRSELHDMQLKH